MSAVDPIMFRAGVDLASFHGDLTKAEKLAVKSTQNIKSQMQSATHAGGGGGHSGHPSGSSSRALGDSLDAITGERGWVMRMTMLQHSLPIAALAGLAIAFEKVTEAVGKLKEATSEARTEINKPMDAAGGIGDVAGDFQAKQKAAEKLRESRGVGTTIGDGLDRFNPFRDKYQEGEAGQAGSRSKQAEKALQEGMIRDAKEFGEITRKNIADREDAAGSGDAKDMELLKARQAAEEKIAHIKNDPKLVGLKQPLIEAAQAELALTEREIARKDAAKQREIDLESDIVSAKVRGRDVALEEAKAREKAAAAELAAARPGQEHEAATAKHTTASWGVRDAQRATDELHAQQRIQTVMAEFRGDSDARHLKQLQEERAELERQSKGSTQDERDKLGPKLAENTRAQAEAGRAVLEKYLTTAATIVEASTGRGQHQQLLSVATRKNLAMGAQLATEADPEASAEKKAQARLAVQNLAKEESNLRDEIAKTNREASGETAILKEQLAHHNEIATAMQRHLAFAEKIREAEKNGNPELVKQLQQQESIATQKQAQDIATRRGDRNKGTLAELAANAFNEDGRKAREAMRLEARAETERKRGHIAASDRLRQRADAVKKGIHGLKDGEKDLGGEFLGSLNKSDILKELQRINLRQAL